METFNIVKKDCSHWAEYDQLEGEDLKDGEQIVIRWPDGYQSLHEVCIKRGTVKIADHGIFVKAPTKIAQIKITIHGYPVMLDIRGMSVRRVNS